MTVNYSEWYNLTRPALPRLRRKLSTAFEMAYDAVTGDFLKLRTRSIMSGMRRCRLILPFYISRQTGQSCIIHLHDMILHILDRRTY